MKPQKSKRSLVNQHATIVEAGIALRRIEELAARNPHDGAIQVLLRSINNILKQLKEASDQAFLDYAHELSIKVTQPDYPHSIKTWYEDEFKYLVEEYKNEQ